MEFNRLDLCQKKNTDTFQVLHLRVGSGKCLGMKQNEENAVSVPRIEDTQNFAHSAGVSLH